MPELPPNVALARPPRFKSYANYKDSRVEWLGRLPGHWDVRCVKRLFRVENGSTPKSDDPTYWDGDIPWVTPDDLGRLDRSVLHATARRITREGYESCGTRLVPADSMILSTRAPIGHLAIAGVPVCTNQGCRALVFRDDDNRRFMYYALLAAIPALEALGRGSTFKELAADDLGDFKLCVPSTVEQVSVAEFLDRETEKIDAMVAKKERLIGFLQEKRTALITTVVTKGLDPDVPMKDSGYEWLGQIPTHWEIRRLKRISPELTVGVVVNPSTYVSDEGVPFLYGGDIREGRITAETARRMNFAQSQALPKSRLRSGDLIMVRVGAPGVTAVVPHELEGANCASVLIIRGARSFDSQWLCYVLNSRAVRHQVEIVQYGAAQEQFNVSHAVEFMVPCPPLEEQRHISTALDRQATKIDALIARIRQGINRLGEFRTALISAAVTGKIDVREEAK